MAIEKDIVMPISKVIAEGGIEQAVSAFADGGAHYRILRKSIDARSREIKFNLKVEIYRDGEEIPPLIRLRP
ncbi:MAG: hypothetical protein ACKO7B_01730, partial [Flavobacteriales bacterium]